MERIEIDGKRVKALFPKRPKDGNKGSFGRAFLLAGSERFPGAAHLAAEGCLRGGVGYAVFSGDEGLCRELRMRFPELLFSRREEADIRECSLISSATLCGPGLGGGKAVLATVRLLLALETSFPLVLDADALNALAGSAELLCEAKRPVVITPHPLEFSRLSGISVAEIAADRVGVAEAFAKAHGVTLLLKGHGTVITDGRQTAVNPTGSTALAKAGSGDVLAGFLAALLAEGAAPFDAAVCAAYLHGLAGDKLALRYSEYGVTASDLPRAIAECISEVLK